MSTLSQEQIDKAVSFIIKQGQNPEVKKALEAQGYKLIPNSLKFIIDSLESAGFQIIRPNKGGQNNKNPETKQGDAPQKTQEKQEKKEVKEQAQQEIKPQKLNVKSFKLFGDREMDSPKKEVNEAREIVEESLPWEKETSDQEEVVSRETAQNNYKTDNQEKLTELKGKWASILQVVKSKSILVYSLVVNAEILGIKENALVLGFSAKHTYQLKQFGRQENQALFAQILNEHLSTNLSVKGIVVQDKK